MVTPITNDLPMTLMGDSKVGASGANPGLRSQDTQDSISSNPYSDIIAKLEKEKADLQQKLNEVIREKDKLREDYASATWYNKIGLGIELGAKLVQILFTAAQLERLSARIKEYSRGGPIF